jgi:hypothetical protein
VKKNAFSFMEKQGQAARLNGRNKRQNDPSKKKIRWPKKGNGGEKTESDFSPSFHSFGCTFWSARHHGKAAGLDGGKKGASDFFAASCVSLRPTSRQPSAPLADRSECIGRKRGTEVEK